MSSQPLRDAAVAGSWYPKSPTLLASEVDLYLSAVPAHVAGGDIRALVSPHAGLVYSGPIAAWAYRSVQGAEFDVAVLVGPSHYHGFDSVAVVPRGAFATPFGPAPIAEEVADAMLASGGVVRDLPLPHVKEHSLEMQLPFLRRVLPDTPIVPLLMGDQSPSLVTGLADTLARALSGRRALLIASSDLSHYLDAQSAAAMDGRVLDLVGRFDADGLLSALQDRPGHACGGGPIVAVMKAARALGARDGRVLKYGDSGDVSGDKRAVVGYMAAAFGEFPAPAPGSGRAS